MDEAAEIEGYDGAVDDGPSYGPAPGRKSGPNPVRKGGKRTLSPSPGARSGQHSRPMGRSFSFRSLGLNINPRELASSVSSLLLVSVIGVIAVVAILYYTFSSGSFPPSLPQFYGALAAAMVFVLLLSYIAVRLLGIAE